MKSIACYSGMIFLFLNILSGCATSQTETINLNKQINYLCLDKKLNDLFEVDNSAIRIYPKNKTETTQPEFTLYREEIPYFLNIIKELDTDSLEKLYQYKGNKNIFPKIESNVNSIKGIRGKRIAIDAGHFAGNMLVAKVEQKFLDFKVVNSAGDSIPVQIAEGILTWQTAQLLKRALEEEGAIVMTTREQVDFTSFGVSYGEWYKNERIRVLDSLKNSGKLSVIEHKKFSKLSMRKFFWEFFRDFELANRVKRINKFKPDISIIIHYNVDEKNKDWKAPTSKNFTMSFIGGGMTADNFEKKMNKLNFLRLLVSQDLIESEKISKLTVDEFSKNLKIKIAGKSDADYLADKCIKTNSQGVFCRNLALCRGIYSPLVYGECLYQDNVDECQELIKNNVSIFGIKTNQRVKTVADSYLNAIKKYFEN